MINVQRSARNLSNAIIRIEAEEGEMKTNADESRETGKNLKLHRFWRYSKGKIQQNLNSVDVRLNMTIGNFKLA